MKGGILSVINELNEIVAWVTTSYHLIILILPGVIPIQRFCQSQSPAEIGEILKQYTLRCKILGIDLPEMLVVDNCCQVRKSVTGAVPEIKVALDVYHFLMR